MHLQLHPAVRSGRSSAATSPFAGTQHQFSSGADGVVADMGERPLDAAALAHFQQISAQVGAGCHLSLTRLRITLAAPAIAP
jgi:hypothetical protein